MTVRYKVIFLCGFAIFIGWILRAAITGNLAYGFVVVNVILAAIPLLIIAAIEAVNRYGKGYVVKACKLALAFVWLLFLPNAFYILTDFMHLNSDVLVNLRDDDGRYTVLYERGDGIYIYDSLLFLAATIYGAYVGGLALLYAYTYLKKRLPNILAYLTMGSIMVLCAVGVYLGRYGRWNSWQGINRPHEVITDLFNNLLTSETYGRFFIVVFTILIFQLVSVLYVYYQQKNQSI